MKLLIICLQIITGILFDAKSTLSMPVYFNIFSKDYASVSITMLNNILEVIFLKLKLQ